MRLHGWLIGSMLAVSAAAFFGCSDGEPASASDDSEFSVTENSSSSGVDLDSLAGGSRLDGSKGICDLAHSGCSSSGSAAGSSAVENGIASSSSVDSDGGVVSSDDRLSSSSTASADSIVNCAVCNRIITGLAQKGPLQAKSSVTLYEMNDTLGFTGRTYRTETFSDNGEYRFTQVNLATDYVVVEVSGNFRNELTGEWSEMPVTLRAVSNLNMRDGNPFQRTEINVNLLTNLEYDRVRNLVREGVSIDSAKMQASTEIMDLFNFSERVDYSEESKLFNGDDGALLALSILFLGNRSDAEVIGLISSFIDDFASDGVWEDSITYVKMADFVSELDYDTVQTNATAWNVKSVPDFGLFLDEFWNTAYGFRLCTEKNKNFILENENSLSGNYGKSYTCQDGKWYQVVSE